MRFDIENQVCRAQAFTGAADQSDYAYEKQTAAQDLSIGRRMALLCIVTTAAGSGSTHTMSAIQADDASLSSNKEVLASVTKLAADLTVGAVFEIPFPQGSMTRKYIGFENSSTGGTTTVSLDVYFVPQDEIAQYKAFPKVVDALV